MAGPGQAGAGGARRAATELFSVPESIVLAASASALPNNLSVLHPTAASKKAVFAVSSMNAVVLAEVDVSARVDVREVTHTVACGTIDKSHFLCPLSVIQAQWVTLDGVQLLAVMGIGYVQLLDRKERQVFRYAMHRGDDGGVGSGDSIHARGVCIVRKYLCFGMSTGAIMVCECSVKGGKVRVVHKADLRGAHDAAVTTLCRDENNRDSVAMASGDATGRVVVWNMDGLDPLLVMGGELPMHVLGTLESPCMSMVLSHGVLAVASFNGLVTFFETNEAKRKILEIAAHARSPTAIAVNRTGTLLASVGEDSKLMVWHFPTLSDRSSALAFSAVIADRMLHGVTFVGTTDAVAVTAYDCNELFIFNRTSGLL